MSFLAAKTRGKGDVCVRVLKLTLFRCGLEIARISIHEEIEKGMEGFDSDEEDEGSSATTSRR